MSHLFSLRSITGEEMIRTWPDGRIKPAISLKGFEDVEVCQAVNELAKPVLETIRLHGKENPIKSFELEERFLTRGTTIRKIMAHANRYGYPVCSSSNGYWWATSEKDVRDMATSLISRGTSITSRGEALLKALEVATIVPEDIPVRVEENGQLGLQIS